MSYDYVTPQGIKGLEEGLEEGRLEVALAVVRGWKC
jgi:hypothetical protein